MLRSELNLSTVKSLESNPIYASLENPSDKANEINSGMSPSEIANVISDKLIKIVAKNLSEAIKEVQINK
jgi:hypothetical protein